MPNSARKRILICDDEEGIRESLNLILEDIYDLTFAKDGNQCISLLKGNLSPDLILLDIKMPQTSGLEVLKQIKKLKPNIKVVIVSGYKSVETAAEASHSGAADYITKPFEKQEILQLVEKLVK